MKWQLSEEQDAYRSTLSDWLADIASPERVRTWFEAADSTEFSSRLARDGWAGVGVPEELGGQGGGLVELALTSELFGQTAAPSSYWLADALAAPLLASRPEVAEAAFAGEHVALLFPAGAIPSAGGPLQVDDEGRVTGRVARVLGAEDATRFIAIVRAESGTFGLWLLGTEGVSVERRDLLDRSRAVADVVLDRAPGEHLDGDAEHLVAGLALRAAVLVAADALGAQQRMLDLAVEYSKQRHQFGVPIGSFQAVKHAAASMLVDVEAARSAVYYAAASVDASEPEAALHAAAVKAQTTAAGARSADSALTMHGAIGFTWEHDLHFFYKRARLDEALFGSPQDWNERIADGLSLLPA